MSKFIENKQKDEKAIKEIRSKVDSIIDGSLDLYLSHYIKLKSIKNIRDIGGFITEDGKQIKKVIELLLDENTKGVLFHCTSGKDKTGVVSVVIEGARILN